MPVPWFRALPILFAVLAVGACAQHPYNLSDDEWSAQSVEEKIALTRMWEAGRLHPPAAVLVPAGVTPAEALAKARLERENAELRQRLAAAAAILARDPP